MRMYIRKDIEFTIPIDVASSDAHTHIERLIFFMSYYVKGNTELTRLLLQLSWPIFSLCFSLGK